MFKSRNRKSGHSVGTLRFIMKYLISPSERPVLFNENLYSYYLK